MVNYFHFLYKQTIKNRFIWLAVPLLLLCILGLWISYYVQSEDPFLTQMDQNIQLTEEIITTFQGEDEVDGLQDQLAMLQLIKENYSQGNYQEAYQKALNATEEQELFKRNLQNREETLLMWQALAEKNLPMEQSGKEKTGFLFLYRWLDALFPLLVILVASFVMTLIISASYRERINQDWLLPLSALKMTATKILFSAIFIIGTLTTITLLMFFLSSIFAGSGSSRYPIIMYTATGLSLAPLSVVLKQSLVLVLLSLLAVIGTSRVFMQLTKNQLVAFFATFFFLVGQSYLPSTMKSFQKIAHLLPGYYIQATKCVTGVLATSSNNSQVTFDQGVWVLGRYIVIIICVSYFIDWLHGISRLA